LSIPFTISLVELEFKLTNGFKRRKGTATIKQKYVASPIFAPFSIFQNKTLEHAINPKRKDRHKRLKKIFLNLSISSFMMISFNPQQVIGMGGISQTTSSYST